MKLLLRLLPALLLPVMLLVGIWIGGHPSALPAPLRDALGGDEELRVYAEAMDLIEDSYYRKVDRSQLVDESLDAAVKSLDDRFSAYFSPEEYRAFEESTSGEFEGVGMTVQEVPQGLRVASVFDDSPAKRAGIRQGELIVAVDGRSLRGKTSNESVALIKGPSGTAVTLTIERDGRERKERLKRERVEVPVVESKLVRRDGRQWAHVRLAAFTSGAHGEVGSAVRRLLRRGADGVVLDLRGNGGGLLNEAVLVSSIFIEDGRIVSTKGRARPERVFEAQGGAIDRDVPVAVLVDKGSASASEIVAGAIQDRDRGRVVGTATFGKGVFQEVDELSNGGALDITVGEYFTPSGKNLGGGGVEQGSGIAPDVTARDRQATPDSDEALNTAIDTLAAT